MTGTGPNVPYWQIRLGAPGEVVTGLEDIAQAVTIICTTQTGSVPLRPEGWVDLLAYLDRPIEAARRRLEREMVRALQALEPRIETPTVAIRAVPGLLGHALAIVTWRPRGAEESVVQVVGIGAGEAAVVAGRVGQPGGVAPLNALAQVPDDHLPQVPHDFGEVL